MQRALRSLVIFAWTQVVLPENMRQKEVSFPHLTYSRDSREYPPTPDLGGLR
jgi:hypothetical protein